MFGSDFRIGSHLEEPLKQAGFVNVVPRKLKVPIGIWPKVRLMDVMMSSTD